MHIHIDKIIVADDEPLQLSGLSHIIKRLVPDAEIFECRHGEEIIDCLNHTQIDLVVTDIRMPLLNGIDVAKFMSRAYPKTKVVFVSAYQEFEYAKIALEHGVKDYLLKPYTVQTIRQMLEKISKIISDEKQASQQKNAYITLRDQADIDEQTNLLADALDVRLLVRWKSVDALKLGAEKAYFISLKAHVKDQTSKSYIEQTIQRSFQHVNIYEIQAEEGHQDCYKYVLILAEHKKDIKQTLELITRHLNDYDPAIRVFFAVSKSDSPLIENAQNIYYDHRKKLHQAFYLSCSQICSSALSSDELLNHFNVPFMNMVRRLLRDGNMNEAIQLFSSQIKCAGGVFPKPEKIKLRFINIISDFLEEVRGFMSLEEYEENILRVYSLIMQCSSWDALLEIVREQFELIRSLSQIKEYPFDTIQDVLYYIQEHFAEDLSLQVLSEMTNYNPSYLSSQIKSLTGLSYTSYLMSIRLDRSCKLLEQSNKQIKDIAAACGFREPSYFIRAFKNREGVTPEYYRKIRRSWSAQ